MKTIDEKLERLNEILDEYETLQGLPRFQHSEIGDEIQSYLNMSNDQLNKLNVEDCGNIAVRLSQQSFHLQRAYNREKATITGMKIAFDKAVAKEIGNYNTYVKYEVNVGAIANQNEYIKLLQDIIARATQRMNRLYGLSEHLQDLSNKFLALQRAKIATLKSIGG